MENNIAIKVKGLTKTYPIYESKNDRMKEALSISRKKYHTDFHALKEVSFEIKKGETIGIIGQNGSGKSTLLKILTGVLSPTLGEVVVNGKVSALLELGAGFNPEMTGMENIYLNGTIMAYTKEEMDVKIPQIVGFADIGEFINQPVKMYSSGMFARLAFAVAINVEPEILIVDEALSVGDAFFQNKCFRKMDELQKSGITILLVSHDISTIKQMCDRVMWLKSGKNKIIDEKNKVCEQYFAYNITQQNSTVADVREQNFDKFKTEKGGVVKFSKLKSRSAEDIFSKEVEVASFFIKDGEGKKTDFLDVRKNYTFHLVSKNLKDIQNAIFGIRFENLKGMKIYGTNTFLADSERTISLKRGEFTEVIFCAELPPLIKGEYLITVAISEGSQRQHRVLTWLNNVIKVNVINDSLADSVLEMDCSIKVNIYDKSNISLY